MPRVRVYDAEELAVNMQETFVSRKVTKRTEFPWKWTQRMQQVGESLAVAYSSNKWQATLDDWVLYKHLAESRNHCFAAPGIMHDLNRPGRSWPVNGPTVDFGDVPMPNAFGELCEFERLDLQLYTRRDRNGGWNVGSADEGVVEVSVPRAYLGGSMIRWSEVGAGKDQPFLVVYTKTGGPMFLIVGEKLEVRTEGIVG